MEGERKMSSTWQMSGRSCIRPEVSRTKTFGKIGVSNGLFFDKHLKFIVLNTKFVPFTVLDLGFLTKERYDEGWVRMVYNTPVVTLTDLKSGRLKHKVIFLYSPEYLLKLYMFEGCKAGLPHERRIQEDSQGSGDHGRLQVRSAKDGLQVQGQTHQDHSWPPPQGHRELHAQWGEGVPGS